MALPISKLLPIRAIKGGIEVVCEVDTRHLTKAYFIVEAHGAHVTQQSSESAQDDPDSRPPLLTIRVCATCMIEYMGYMNNKIGELA